MKIESVAIDKVKPYEKNPRLNEATIDKLAKSIKEFGFRQPLVVDSSFNIIAGHTRLLAAKKLGLSEVPIHIADNLTPKQIKAYRIADNRIGMDSTWNTGLLTDELKELKLEDYDLVLLGFDSCELDGFLNPIKIEDEEFEDRAPGLSEDEVSKLGDVWILGDHRLCCGDSTILEDVEKLIKDHKPNLMVTDPPYGVDYNPQWRNESFNEANRAVGLVKNDDRVDWLDTYSLFQGNIAYIWHSAKFTHVIAKNIEDCGFDLISQIIWAKQHFAISRGDYHWKHEPCWYAVRKSSTHNWQGARDQSTIWEIDNNLSQSRGNEKETLTGHGTQKPIECMLRPIINNSCRGEYIYDPFGGSGTTLIACEKSSRKCLMMELDPKYCDVIVKRWQECTGKKATLEGSNLSFEEIKDGAISDKVGQACDSLQA